MSAGSRMLEKLLLLLTLLGASIAANPWTFSNPPDEASNIGENPVYILDSSQTFQWKDNGTTEAISLLLWQYEGGISHTLCDDCTDRKAFEWDGTLPSGQDLSQGNTFFLQLYSFSTFETLAYSHLFNIAVRGESLAVVSFTTTQDVTTFTTVTRTESSSTITSTGTDTAAASSSTTLDAASSSSSQTTSSSKSTSSARTTISSLTSKNATSATYPPVSSSTQTQEPTSSGTPAGEQPPFSGGKMTGHLQTALGLGLGISLPVLALWLFCVYRGYRDLHKKRHEPLRTTDSDGEGGGRAGQPGNGEEHGLTNISVDRPGAIGAVSPISPQSEATFVDVGKTKAAELPSEVVSPPPAYDSYTPELPGHQPHVHNPNAFELE